MRQELAAYLDDMDLTRRILEIGPLNNPILTRDEANVFYADVRSQEDVKLAYAEVDRVDKSAIIPLDYVITGSYTKSLKGEPPFDYILMSHVLEHIPRLIEFFQDIAGVMADRARIYTFMPDHRYCYDHFRHPTSFAEAYYVHTEKLACPEWRILDYFVETAPVNSPTMYWQESCSARLNLPKPRLTMDEAVARFERDRRSGINCHYSVFSPRSFLLLMLNLVRARLFPFRLESFFPTQVNEFTFGAVLQLSPSMLEDPALRGAEENKLIAFMDHESITGGRTSA